MKIKYFIYLVVFSLLFTTCGNTIMEWELAHLIKGKPGDVVVNAEWPVITAQPAEWTDTVQNTTISTINVEAYSPDGGTLTYQWYNSYYNNPLFDVPISGANSASFIPPTTDGFGNVLYYVVVTNTILDNGDGGNKIASKKSVQASFSVDSIDNFINRNMEMVNVPDDDEVAFRMGVNLGGVGTDMEPTFDVSFSSGYYMSRYLVTQEQYEAVMRNKPSEHRVGGLRASFVTGLNTAKFPVETVSWYDAIVFCNRLSLLAGLRPAYKIGDSTNPDEWGPVPEFDNPTWNAVVIDGDSNGYRLPTEAQWEYAAKGGMSSQGYSYSGNDNPDEVAWHSGNSGNRTHQVGSKAPNELGLYDMSGNVSEWCWDWHEEYDPDAKTNPPGATSGFERVHRGGSWDDTDGVARSVNRLNLNPNERFNVIGFRLVRPY